MKTRESLVAFVLLLIAAPVGAQVQNWTRIHAGTATGVTLLPDGAIVAVIDGTTYRSTDAGQSWITGGAGPENTTALRAHPNGSIYAGSFFGRDGLSVSTNGGAGWSSRGDIRAWDVAFNSEGNIFVATESSFVLRSNDDGASWTQVSDGSGLPPVWSIAVDAEDNIYAGAQYGEIYHSTDNGVSWTSLPQQASAIVDGLAIAGDGSLYMSGATGLGVMDGSTPLIGFYRSTNRGNSWTDISPEDSAQIGKRVAITPSGTLYVAATSVKRPGITEVLTSTNRGDDWKPVAQDLTFGLVNEIVIDPHDRLYVAAADGLYILDATSSAHESTIPSGVDGRLGVYTELNGAVYIRMTLEKSSESRLQLIDMQGREVESIPLQAFSPGEHRFNVAEFNLPAGMYLCRLADQAGTEGVKVVVRD